MKPSSRRPTHCLFAQLIILTITLTFGSPCYSTNFFVDSRDGNDQNDGSSDYPWKSISKVNNSQFAPGDRILFRRNRTWNEMLIIPSSGVEGQLINFDAYGEGYFPIIDCTFPIDLSWTQDPENPNIYSIPRLYAPGVLFYNDLPYHSTFTITLDPATETLPDPGAVLLQMSNGPYTNIWITNVDEATMVVSGITNFTTWDTNREIIIRQTNPNTGKEETIRNIPAPVDITPKNISLQENGQWNWRNGRLYLYTDVHPDNVNIRAPKFNFGITTNHEDYINIKNLKIIGAHSAGVNITQTNYSKFQKLRIAASGALTYRSGIILNDSSYNDLSFNRVEQTLGAGISVYGRVLGARHNNIRNNFIRDTGSSGISLGGESPSLVEYNSVVSNQIERANQLTYDSAGIYMVISGVGNELRRNKISDGGSNQLRSAGIMLDTNASPVLVERNRIRNNSHGAIVLTETDHILRYNILQNNSLPQYKSAEIIFFRVNDYAANIQVYNNTIEAEPDMPFFRVENGSDINHYIDLNRYYGGMTAPFYWKNQWMTYEQWQQSTGHDLNSRY